MYHYVRREQGAVGSAHGGRRTRAGMAWQWPLRLRVVCVCRCAGDAALFRCEQVPGCSVPGRAEGPGKACSWIAAGAAIKSAQAVGW